VQLRRHRATLDERVGNRPADLARCAHRLLRHLLAAQLRSWYFDCDEGVLDASRLARLIIRPLERDLYKRQAEIRCPDTVVTLLIDNSGSMRGASMTMAAVCAEVIGRTLERCAIKTEILGFTTRTWRGGRAALEWTRAGRPAAPGRIAELRHLIFKTADEPWRRARLSLGAMLADELMKENIDGEALLWAHQRLLRRPERRKIMIVISDGSPLDEATFKGNGRGYLERHLRTVIADIERLGAVEIAALGIGHDVRAYYRRAMTLRGIEELGEALVMQLIEMLGVDRRPP
jgi:cobaltochelatase CobT